jgi:hypothetical protein
MKDNFNRYVWVSFGMVFGALVIAIIAFYFLSGDITSRSSAVSAARVLIAQQNNSLLAFAEIKQDSVAAAKYKTAMDKLLPMQSELINFPQWLQTVAATYNVTADFSFTTSMVPATPTNPGTIGFSLTANGGNANVISFLKNIESQEPGFLLSLGPVTLSQNGDNTNVVVGGNLFFR